MSHFHFITSFIIKSNSLYVFLIFLIKTLSALETIDIDPYQFSECASARLLEELTLDRQIEDYDTIYSKVSLPINQSTPIPGLKRIVHKAIWSTMRRHELYQKANELHDNLKDRLIFILADQNVINNMVTPHALMIITYEIGLYIENSDNPNTFKNGQKNLACIQEALLSLTQGETFYLKFTQFMQNQGDLLNFENHQINNTDFYNDLPQHAHKNTYTAFLSFSKQCIRPATSLIPYFDYIIFGDQETLIPFEILGKGAIDKRQKMFYGLPLFQSTWLTAHTFKTPLSFFRHDCSHSEMNLFSLKHKNGMHHKKILNLIYLKAKGASSHTSFLTRFSLFLAIWHIHEDGKLFKDLHFSPNSLTRLSIPEIHGTKIDSTYNFPIYNLIVNSLYALLIFDSPHPTTMDIIRTTIQHFTKTLPDELILIPQNNTDILKALKWSIEECPVIPKSFQYKKEFINHDIDITRSKMQEICDYFFSEMTR